MIYIYIILFALSGSCFATDNLQNYKPLGQQETHVNQAPTYVPPVLVIPSSTECEHQANEYEVESCKLEGSLISHARYLSRLEDCNKIRDIPNLLCKWGKNVTFADSIYGSALVGYSPDHEKCHLIQNEEMEFACLQRKAHLFGSAIYENNLAQEIIDINGESPSSREEIRLATEESLEKARRKRNCAISVGAVGAGVLTAMTTNSNAKGALGTIGVLFGGAGIANNCGR